MDLHTKPGKKRGRVRLVAGISIPEFRACIPLFTRREMSVHEHQDRERVKIFYNDNGSIG